VAGATAAAPIPPAAGEVRIDVEPASSADAVALVAGVVARAGSVPVTGFSLERLAALGAADASGLADLLHELKDLGLAGITAADAGAAGVRAWLAAAEAAGLVVGRLSAGDRDVDRLLEIRGWGPLPVVRTLAPLPASVGETPTTGYADVRRVALARVLVDNIASIQVDWSRYGPKLAQVALAFGADDLDAVSPASDHVDGWRRAPLEEVTRNVRAAALVPMERDGRFEMRDA